ncbi:cadherin domain-containing protein [Hyphococcus sp.]|uniref:cadherin domain-containing protein n=1 Tax=Hyphococcus sp. TaxID=2038636 RepID=UPI002087796F|nr:MAG: hypothetical protein DHS20C04_12460 [Marinicaulis sp.]
MAKDHPAQEPSAAKTERNHSDERRAQEDAAYENDREALKKARDEDRPDFDGGEEADAHGNLHFGKQNLNESHKAAGSNSLAEASGVSGVATTEAELKEPTSRSKSAATDEKQDAQNDSHTSGTSVDVPEATTEGQAFSASVRSANPSIEIGAELNSLSNKSESVREKQSSETRRQTELVEGKQQPVSEEPVIVNDDTAQGATDVDQSNDGGESESDNSDDLSAPENQAPTGIAFELQPAFENEAGAVVARLNSTDPDNDDTAEYSIAEDLSNTFEIVGDELRLRAGVAFDFEAQNSFSLSIRVTDSAGNTYEEAVTIDVTNVNENPSEASLSNLVVSENVAGGNVGTLSATDPDAGDSVAFSVSDERFEIIGDQLKLKAGITFDAELEGDISLTVTAIDEGGLSSTTEFLISVADVNEAPSNVFLSNYSITENLTGGVVGIVSATDPDIGDTIVFEISDNRFEVVGDNLKLKDGIFLDAESSDPINLTITATDAKGLSATNNFSIDVENVNEGPTLSVVSSSGLKASYFNIGHSLSNLDQVDFDATPDAKGVVDSLDYMAGQDAFWAGAPSDYFAAKYEGQLNIADGGMYVFNMASDDGSVLFIDGEAVLDNDGLHGTRTRSVSLELDAGLHDIEVRYFENGGAQTLQLAWSGPDTGGINEVIGGDAFQNGASLDNLVLADDEAGAVVAQLGVSDPDIDDTHSFVVSDDRFEVAELDGGLFLKLKADSSIDYESEQSVNLTVTVTDAAGASDTLEFPITVEDVNQAPSISLIGGEGLQASYYNIGHSLSDLNQVDFEATPDAQGVVNSLNYMNGQDVFWDGAPGDYFAAKYEGQLLVEEAGQYNFYLASDDGSMMFIDGVAVLDNDGLHSTSTRSVSIELDSGAHDIEVRYFENGGAQTLQLAWAGPDTGGATEVIDSQNYRLPGFDDGDLLGVSENATGDIAARLSITDDDGPVSNITLSDDRFEVVSDETGYILKLKDGVQVDYETESEISVEVTATDAKGESSSQTFVVSVRNVSEAPTDFGLTPTNRTGILSLNSDGGTDDVAIASNLEGFPTSALTVEVRFSSDQTDVGNGTPLFSYAASNGSDNEALIWLEGASGKLNIFLAGQKVNTGIPNSSLLDGQEHQVSFSWDQTSNDLKVYVDGKAAFDTSINIRDLKANGTLVFGQEQDNQGGGFASNQVFEGEISEVRIFDYARSEAEISENFGASINHPDTEPGLINNWAMNSDAGGYVEDLAGGNDLQLVNGAHVEGGLPFEAPTVFENSPGAVAGVLAATDADTGLAINEFVIVSDPSGAFEIVGNEIKLKDGVSLDREAQDAYEVVVDAIGAGGVATQQVFSISVANVDEAPIGFTLTPASSDHILSLNQDGGNNDAAIAQNIEGFPTDALTVEILFSSDQTNVGDGTPLFSYAASNGSNNEALVWLEGASGNLNIFLAGTKYNTGIPNSTLLDGEPHQVSFTWDQSTNELKVYIDGEPSFETAANVRDLKAGGTLALGQEQDSEGGGFDSNQIFEGEFAEVRIFDYARNQVEIAENAGSPISNPETEPGLVNDWVMNSEVGGIVEDLVGGNDLQLQGGAKIQNSDGTTDPHVAENNAGALVGILSAQDPETGEMVTNFAIEFDPSGLFEIVGNELKVKSGAALDYEAQQAHDVVVRANSAGGESSLLSVTVQVDDGADLNIIDGSGENDRLRGTDGNDSISGGEGNDVIRGRGGDDVISGGDGNDNIAGNAGADQLYGGAGDDLIYADSDDTVIDGGEGTDRVIVQGDGDFSIDMAASDVERVDGGGGNDAIDASSATEAVRQYGNAGDDVLTGGSGNDIQRGGDGDDVISGGDGNDNIDGGSGEDRLTGGVGNDRIVGGDGNDTVVYSGNRADYTIQKINETTFRVIDNRTDSPDGTDRVSSAEVFEFADQSVDVADILNAPPTDISLTPVTSIRTVAAAVDNSVLTTANGGGSGTAIVDLTSATDGSEMITMAFGSIDNSFELLVNGQSISGETLQLQSNVYQPDSQAFLKFQDGSAINSPWVANGDGAPRVIVQVTENNVQVFAMRNPNSGNYEPMTIVNGEFTPPVFLDGENTVTVINPDDDGPDGLSVTVSAQFDEVISGPVEGENGAVVGALSVTDSDAIAPASFSISNDSSDAFEVVGNELKVKDGMSLDADDQSSHEITINVMDEHGAIYQETLTVEVQATRPAASQFIIGDGDGNALSGSDRDDSIYGGGGDDTLNGGAGDDFLSGGDGSDVFVYDMGDGSDHMVGGSGDGWVDVIQLNDGAMPLGEFGTDWTVDLTDGTVNSVDEASVIFSDDASGHITLSDGSIINFAEIEQITF